MRIRPATSANASGIPTNTCKTTPTVEPPFPSSSLPEVARWVLGCGRHTQVLKPSELVSLMKSHIEELASRYEPKTSPVP